MKKTPATEKKSSPPGNPETIGGVTQWEKSELRVIRLDESPSGLRIDRRE